MQTRRRFLQGRTALSCLVCAAMLARTHDTPGSSPTNSPIPLAELSTRAGAQYQGDGVSILPGPKGARLRCVFQKLEGQATAEGLWLTSTADGAKGDHFRVVATSIGRAVEGSAERQPQRGGMFLACTQPERFQAPAGRHDGPASGDPAHAAPTELGDIRGVVDCKHGAPNGAVAPEPLDARALARIGTVAVVEKLAHFVRPALVEEYSVNVDDEDEHCAGFVAFVLEGFHAAGEHGSEPDQLGAARKSKFLSVSVGQPRSLRAVSPGPSLV